ncbi:unnamed protein product [Fraxinus pennsylvanica]|uniref:PXA domain-containing protein n=1 Tax=Fraxinus pennsylvanica TaxID=56036 RepID=A0AAD2DZ33_9LAMI|nr:unnamed protein product [Fraxinus pennsylvanica]
MLMNASIADLLVSGLRMLFNEVEFRWKVHNARPQSYLSHLEKKQLSANDSHLTTTPPPPKWKKKIDSAVVEAAMQDFIDKFLRDFVIDLWYSDVTPDKEAPELIRAVIMDAFGEVSGRLKAVNLVDLLTRKNQAFIGVDVTGTLSSEERDERLKHHLLASKQLHPAFLMCEYNSFLNFKGVSDSLMQKVVGSRSSTCEPAYLVTSRTFSWNADNIKKLTLSHNTTESTNSFSDNEEGDKDESHGQQEVEYAAQANGWHSDYELNPKAFPPRTVTCDEDFTLHSKEIRAQSTQSELHGLSRYSEVSLAITSVPQEDPSGMPPEVQW